MPAPLTKIPDFKPTKDVNIEWKGWKGGWNNIFKPTELKANELSQADNLMLIGEGVPTGRWGSVVYNQAGESGRVRFLGAFYKSQTSTNTLLTVTDDGYLTKKINASYSIITGASFPSGSEVTGVQLGGNLYFSGGPSRTFVKFDGNNLIPYNSIAKPASVTATNLSGVSGVNIQAWRISANSQTGETLASDSLQLVNLPQNLADTTVLVTWGTVSAASGVLKSYNVYRGQPGDETWIATVPSGTTSYYDKGAAQSDTIFPPNSDTTSGPRAKYIIKFDDRLILSGFEDDPSLVLISARYPYHDRFNWADGGGFTRVDPDGGEDILGLGVAGSQGSDNAAASILVFKNNSTHRVVLSSVSIGNYSVLDPQVQMLTTSNGCSSHKTIVPVENDTFYFGRKGLYVVGQEPNFLNQIRTNELSARIRPYVRNLSDSDFKEANAIYIDNKYILSFPSKKESIIYDRERAAFMGPWKTPWGITGWLKYFDTSGVEKWLAATYGTNPYVREFSDSYLDDSGTAVKKTLRTKKEDLGSWSVMKIIKLIYVLFRNVRGQVTVNFRLETRDGVTVTQKSFTITSSLGTGGFGADQYGSQQYGQSDATVSLTGDELVRWTQLYKNARVIQIEVLSTTSNTNWEFLSSRITAQPLGDSSLSATTRV